MEPLLPRARERSWGRGMEAGCADRGLGLEELSCSGELGSEVASGHEPVVADAHEAIGQDVEEEAVEELSGG